MGKVHALLVLCCSHINQAAQQSTLVEAQGSVPPTDRPCGHVPCTLAALVGCPGEAACVQMWPHVVVLRCGRHKPMRSGLPPAVPRAHPVSGFTLLLLLLLLPVVLAALHGFVCLAGCTLVSSWPCFRCCHTVTAEPRSSGRGNVLPRHVQAQDAASIAWHVVDPCASGLPSSSSLQTQMACCGAWALCHRGAHNTDVYMLQFM
jgi:hypothetical protein